MALPFLLGAGLQLGALALGSRYKQHMLEQAEERQYKKDRDRLEQTAQRVRGLIGAPQKEYKMSQDELFPGEQPIQGLQQKGTGLLGGAISAPEFYGGLMSTPGYEQFGAEGLMRAMNPGQPELTPLQRNLESMGVVPGSPEYNDMMMRGLGLVPEAPEPPAPTSLMQNLSAIYGPDWQSNPEAVGFAQQAMVRPSTQVTVGDQLRTIDDEVRLGDIQAQSERARGRIGEVYEMSKESHTLLPEINRTLKLIDEVRTGPFAEQKYELVAKANELLGTNMLADEITSAEELKTLLGNQVMRRIAESKGDINQRELDMYISMSANFGNTPEGNKAILEFQRRRLERTRELASKVDEWESQGLSSMEIEDRIDSYLRQNDLSNILAQGKRGAEAAQPATQQQPRGSYSAPLSVPPDASEIPEWAMPFAPMPGTVPPNTPKQGIDDLVEKYGG